MSQVHRLSRDMRKFPVAVTKSARWWPWVLPVGGHLCFVKFFPAVSSLVFLPGWLGFRPFGRQG